MNSRFEKVYVELLARLDVDGVRFERLKFAYIRHLVEEACAERRDISVRVDAKYFLTINVALMVYEPLEKGGGFYERRFAGLRPTSRGPAVLDMSVFDSQIRDDLRRIIDEAAESWKSETDVGREYEREVLAEPDDARQVRTLTGGMVLEATGRVYRKLGLSSINLWG